MANAAALHASGIDADKAIRDSDLVAAIHRAMAKPGEPPVTTQAILDTIARGQTAAGSSGHQWPPIIRMSEADGYFFKSGSAELSPTFHDALMDQTPFEILKYIQKYDVDVIEVVGHTDERPIGNRQYSNLDRDLLSVLKEHRRRRQPYPLGQRRTWARARRRGGERVAPEPAAGRI